jgi:argininosuccinate lyase
MLATDLADFLVKSGVPFREAHGLVGRLVRAAEELGTPLDRLPAEIFEKVSAHFAGADLTALFDARRSLEARAGVGGTAPTAVADQIAGLRSLL